MRKRKKLTNVEIVILIGAPRSLIARGAVEGPAVCSQRQHRALSFNQALRSPGANPL